MNLGFLSLNYRLKLLQQAIEVYTYLSKRIPHPSYDPVYLHKVWSHHHTIQKFLNLKIQMNKSKSKKRKSLKILFLFQKKRIRLLVEQIHMKIIRKNITKLETPDEVLSSDNTSLSLTKQVANLQTLHLLWHLYQLIEDRIIYFITSTKNYMFRALKI